MSEDLPWSEWSLLEPTAEQQRNMEKRLFAWLEARDTSLAAEWLGTLSRHPIEVLGYAAASALALMLLTPIGWLGSLL